MCSLFIYFFIYLSLRFDNILQLEAICLMTGGHHFGAASYKVHLIHRRRALFDRFERSFAPLWCSENAGEKLVGGFPVDLDI